MGAALGWGLFAGSSLILGGVIALGFPIGGRRLGLMMAFGAGVLISAVAYELVAEAFDTSTERRRRARALGWRPVFFVGNGSIDRMGGDGARDPGPAGAGSALPIVLGTVLDGVPESAVLGLTLLGGTGVSSMFVAVFLSNLPEAIAATTGLSAAAGARPDDGLWGARGGVRGWRPLGYMVFERPRRRRSRSCSRSRAARS